MPRGTANLDAFRQILIKNSKRKS